MKDIDFDELDRAVSSALGSPKPEPVASAPVETSVTPVAPPTPPVAVQRPPAVPPAIIRDQASPAIRRGGRFMDVVHPSSDMKASAPRLPKRTFGPVSDDMKNAPAPVIPAVPEIVPEASLVDSLPVESFDSIESVEKEPPVVAAEATHAWPDPLDINPIESTPKEEIVEEPKAEEVPVEEKPEADESPTSPPDMSQTPFLADTKVDKRPLGTFAEYEPGPEVVGIGENASFKPAGDSSVSAELASDLVAIESNEMPSQEERSDEKDDKEEKKEVAPEAEAPSDAQPTSIAPQYHAEEKTAETDTDYHSVFDTSTYHQPLLPQKTHGKSRAWIWILIVVGLLIVGAGLGALFFMAGF